MSETSISPLILYTRNKKPMIICDCCGIINKISDKCVARGPSFQPPTIHQIFFSKIPNMDQIQKWYRLSGKPTLQSLNISISMHRTLQYMISSSLSQAQHSSNYIYLISYLLSVQMILIYLNLHMYQLQVYLVSHMTMMIP